MMYIDKKIIKEHKNIRKMKYFYKKRSRSWNFLLRSFNTCSSEEGLLDKNVRHFGDSDYSCWLSRFEYMGISSFKLFCKINEYKDLNQLEGLAFQMGTTDISLLSANFKGDAFGSEVSLGTSYEASKQKAYLYVHTIKQFNGRIINEAVFFIGSSLIKESSFDALYGTLNSSASPSN